MYKWVHKKENQVTQRQTKRPLKTIPPYCSQEAIDHTLSATEGFGLKNSQKVRKQGPGSMWKQGHGIHDHVHLCAQIQDNPRVDLKQKVDQEKIKWETIWWQREQRSFLVSSWVWSRDKSTLKKWFLRISNNGPAPQISTTHMKDSYDKK